MISIVLVEPEIPANTGNIARTCACLGADLYLVGKLGFDTSEASIKRAGLDYWDKLNIYYVNDIHSLVKEKGEEKFFFLSSKTKNIYTDAEYPADAFLVFGKETKGLSADVLSAYESRCYRIPMASNARCLNLSNAAALVAYEAVRQNKYEQLK